MKGDGIVLYYSASRSFFIVLAQALELLALALVLLVRVPLAQAVARQRHGT
ncbi:hypothetical protein CULC0102_1617 [Corynebacterium ulcerans 0102]|nr:hypothetical protein CULC0102_1617 [Corynebacterium ulcerans 0102]